MPHIDHHPETPPSSAVPPQIAAWQRGQALVEYVLIIVLFALLVGVALAATGPIIGNVFENSIDDVLRQTEVGEIPGREEYWGTVTAAFLTPIEEVAIPPNTLAPPTTEPTEGPPPTATPISPTPTPSSTRTPTLTPTAVDKAHDLPFYDSVDYEPIQKNTFNWWRSDANLLDIKDSLPWAAQFYNDTNFTDQAAYITGVFNIDFTGTSAVPWVVGTLPTNFSVEFWREIKLSQPRVLALRMLVDDGAEIRVFNYTPDPDPTVKGDIGSEITLNDAGVYKLGETSNSDKPQWYDAASPELAAGSYYLQVKYKQIAGNSRLRVLVQDGGANPDDGSAPTVGQSYSCSWGQNFRRFGNDGNTEIGMWDDFHIPYSDDDMKTNPELYVDNGDYVLPNNSECNLELRGAVKVPAGVTNPQLTWWDVWDFKANTSARLEVARYVQETEANAQGTPPYNPQLDRDATEWIVVPNSVWQTHAPGTKNYNYSRQVVDLSEIEDAGGAPLLTPGAETLVTFRFVVTRTGGTGTPNRWYVDDIRVAEGQAPVTYKLNHPVWTLDNNEQMDDFIFTGGKSNDGFISGWRLTSVNKLGPGGSSFHESVGPDDTIGGAGVDGEFTDSKAFTESSNPVTDLVNMRVHYLEFEGTVDLDPTVLEDAEENKGDAVLAFYQGYHLRSNTGLEVQWRNADNSNQWTAFPDGVIRAVTETTSVASLTLQEKLVSLEDFDLDGDDPQFIRIRFVMKIQTNVPLPAGDGWWIDQIRIGREESPKWLDFPVVEGAEYFTSGPWRYQGKWAQTSIKGRVHPDDPVEQDDFNRRSYGSSPGGTYDAGQKTWMEGRFAVDLYNDTQNGVDEKVIWGRTDETNPPESDPNNLGGAAVNPLLIFWHSRDLGNSDDILVQWKRLDAPDTAWKTVWYYKNGQRTNPVGVNAETARQKVWERVEVDLTDVMTDINSNNNASNFRDDDILFRFYLDAKGSTNGEGVYIDDIEIRERPNETNNKIAWRLWPNTQNRNNPFSPGEELGLGQGTFLTDDPDASSTNRIWTESWFYGGNWYAVDWAGSRVGLFAFHDSPHGDPNNQTSAPNGSGDVPDIGDALFYTTQDQFQVLELNQIIDLRAVDQVTENPILRFWSRYHLGDSNKVRVEISYEMDYKPNGTGQTADDAPYTQAELDADIATRCNKLTFGYPVRQCYEQRRGWSPWAVVNPSWEVNVPSGNNERRSYGWTREQVRLVDFSANTDPGVLRRGKRIRVRFVYDTLTNNTAPRDGWYIDNITFEHSRPPIEEDANIAEAPYSNAASDSIGVLFEGKWGLDPRIFEGVAGTPATIGIWQAKWWNCANCANEPDANGNFVNGASIFLTKPDRPAPNATASYTALSMTTNSRPPGTSAPFPTDRFVGEINVDTPPIGGSISAGPKSLLITSDDGVRVKHYEIDGAGNPVGTIPATWNVIDKWQLQSATTTNGLMTFVNGKRYRILLQYFDSTSTAVLIAQFGDAKYSFSDSPRVGGANTTDVPPISFGNTSLRIRRVLDLSEVTSQFVFLKYRTVYRIGSRSSAKVEVSSNGGFTWESDPLDDPITGVPINGTSITDSINNPSGSPVWVDRWHNLNSYRGSSIVLRFRLDRQNEWCARTKIVTGDPNPLRCTPAGSGADESIDGFFDGWWISEIRVFTQ
ncbi:MAG: hypothetical protein H7Y11_00020 [Armatimonadetes bacterium]|nr:hypothetical protein [Anaerolineae bacterium]